MASLILSPEAAADLEEIVEYIASDNVDARLHGSSTEPGMSRPFSPGSDSASLVPGSWWLEPASAKPLPAVKLSKTRLKKMREEVQRRLAKKREARRTVVPQPPPRYDEVFAEGVAWLDGPEPEP